MLLIQLIAKYPRPYMFYDLFYSASIQIVIDSMDSATELLYTYSDLTRLKYTLFSQG